MSDHPNPLQGLAHVATLCDLSSAAMNAAWRAALLARDLRVPLQVLYQSVPPRDEDAPLPLRSFAAEAGHRLGVDIALRPVLDDALHETVALARGGLLVIPSTRGNPICERLVGTPAERLIRLVRGPVLVAKRPARAAYRRIFVPVDLRAGSEALLAAATSLSRGTGTVAFHALQPAGELMLAELDAPSVAMREYRIRRVAHARRAIDAMLAQQARHVGGTTSTDAILDSVISFGPPGETILAGEHAHRAELLVIGKRRRGLLADFFLGSVTQRVLAQSQADVLVVPLMAGSQAAGAPGEDGRAPQALPETQPQAVAGLMQHRWPSQARAAFAGHDPAARPEVVR